MFLELIGMVFRWMLAAFGYVKRNLKFTALLETC